MYNIYIYIYKEIFEAMSTYTHAYVYTNVTDGHVYTQAAEKSVSRRACISALVRGYVHTYVYVMSAYAYKTEVRKRGQTERNIR